MPKFRAKDKDCQELNLENFQEFESRVGSGVSSGVGTVSDDRSFADFGFTKIWRFADSSLTKALKKTSRRARDVYSSVDTPESFKTKEPDSTKAAKLVKVKEKKVQKKRTVKYSGETVTAKALDIDVDGGEIAPFKPMTEKTLKRMNECLSWMKLATPEDYSKFKKTDGYTCQVAFCPICAAFQSRRDGLKLSTMMDGMQDLPNIPNIFDRYGTVACNPYVVKAATTGVEFIMLGLSSPNVTDIILKSEQSKYAKAFNNMIDDWFASDYKKYYLGYARKLEVTYNKQKIITKQMWEGTGKYNHPWKYKFRHMGLKIGDRNPHFGTYNPHYHVILAVTPDFFYTADDGTEHMKVSKEQWLAKWVKYMGNPDIKILDVRRIYKTRGEGNSAIAEVSKYVAKDSDYLYSQKVFKVFYGALKGCKRLTFGGIFQTFNKLFKDDKLVRYIPVDDTDYKWKIEYTWAGDCYHEIKRRLLSAVEASKIRGMKYNDVYDTDDF